MIDVSYEILIPFCNLPAWSQKKTRKRSHPSTFQRWRSRGVHGVRLESILIGGERYTSEEALQRFFAAITAAADGQPVESYAPADPNQDAADETFLASQGI